MADMKLHAPDKCPFCGSRLSGGGDHTAYYDCGSHIWIEPQREEWECSLKGHMGLCKEVVAGDVNPSEPVKILAQETDERGLTHVVYKKGGDQS